MVIDEHPSNVMGGHVEVRFKVFEQDKALVVDVVIILGFLACRLVFI